MIIETKIEFKQYPKLMYILTYRNPVVIVSTLFILTCIITTISVLLSLDIPLNSSFILPQVFVFLVLGLRPIMVYFNSKKNFAANARLQEKIRYEFTNDKIITTGESFSSERDWEKTNRIVELNNWILLYETRTIANLIPKEAFGDKLNEFKTLVRSKPSIRQKLK